MTEQEIWADMDEKVYKRYLEIKAETRRLQEEFGIKPKTLEERHEDLLKRKEEEQKRAEQVRLLNSLPKPKLPPRRQ